MLTLLTFVQMTHLCMNIVLVIILRVMSWQYLVLLVLWFNGILTFLKLSDNFTQSWGKAQWVPVWHFVKMCPFFSIPHCGCVCRISTLIMVPINFCEILTCLKPKEHNFVAQRLIELERSKENLWKCLKKISQVQTINLWNIFGAMMSSIKLDNFGYSWQRNDLLGSKCHIPMLQSPV